MKKQRNLYLIALVLLLALSIMLITACSDPKVPEDNTSTETQDGTAEVNDADNIVTNGTFYSAYNKSGSSYVKKDTIKGWSNKTGSAIYTATDNKNTANTTFGLVQGVVDLAKWGETNGINRTVFGSETVPENRVDFSKINVNTNPNKPYSDTNALMIASDMSGDEIYNSSSYYYTSTTFTASAGKTYELSIDVLTLLLNGNTLDAETGDSWNSEDYKKGAYIVVTDSNTSYALHKVEAINTYGEWETIKIIINANGESDVKIGVQLWMGHGTAYVQSGTVNERLTKGICLFDNVIMKESTDAVYTEAVEKIEEKVRGDIANAIEPITDANSTYQKDGSKYVLDLRDWSTNKKHSLYSYASKSSTSTSYDYYYTARVGNPSAYTVMKGVENYSEYTSDELPYYSSSSYLPYGIFDYSKVYADNNYDIKDYAEYNKTDWASFRKTDFFNADDVFDNNAFHTAFPTVELKDTLGLLVYNYVPSAVGYKTNDLITIEQGKYYTINVYTYLYQALQLDPKATDVSVDDANKNITKIKTFNNASRTVKATAKMTDVTFDGQNTSIEYQVTGYAEYAEAYRQAVLANTAISLDIREKWDALGVISALPTDMEYYYELSSTTSSGTKYYKMAMGETKLPTYAEGGWEVITYNITGNSLGDREMGMQLWLGEGLKDAATLVMGGAIFADIQIESYTTAQTNVVYKQLSSFDAGDNYDVYGMTAGALLDASNNLVGSVRNNTFTIGEDTYIVNPDAASYAGKILSDNSVGKYDQTIQKLTIGDKIRYFADNVDDYTLASTVFTDKNKNNAVSNEVYIKDLNMYVVLDGNYDPSEVYYIKGDKVYQTALVAYSMPNNNAISIDADNDGTAETYTVREMTGNYVDVQDRSFTFEAVEGLFNTGSMQAYVVSSSITKTAWEGDSALKVNPYPFEDGVKLADSLDANTAFETIVISHTSHTASIFTLGDESGVVGGAKVYPNKYYRYSILVKTDVNNSGSATLQLIAWNTEADRKTTTSLKSVSSVDTQGEWVEYVFYISGAYVEGMDYNALTAQVLFGSGDAYSPDTHAKGVIYLTAPTFIEVTYSEYSSKNTGENVSSYSYSSSLYTSETVTNGRFTSVDYDATKDANADYDINAYDENGKLIGIGTPSGGWTAVEANYDKLTTPTSKLNTATAVLAYDVNLIDLSVANNSVEHTTGNVDNVRFVDSTSAKAYVLYKKTRLTTSLGKLQEGSIVKDKITITIDASDRTIATLIVPNSTSKEYTNYVLYNGTDTPSIGTVVHDNTKGQDTVTFTISEHYFDNSVTLYYDTDEWDYATPYVATLKDAGNNIYGLDGISNPSAIVYTYGYAKVDKEYSEALSGVTATSAEAETTISWSKTTKATNYFVAYKVSIKDGNTEVDTATITNIDTVSYTTTGSIAYNADYTYTVEAIWAVADAKKTNVESFTITWSHTLTQTATDTNFANYYGYEVYFVQDGESSKDKYFIALLDSTTLINSNADFANGLITLTDAPSTSAGTTTHTYTYTYTLPRLVKGTYYIRAVVDSALRGTVIPGESMTYGQKYCPSNYVTVYFDPAIYIADNKQWVNWTSATFTEFKFAEGGLTTETMPNIYTKYTYAGVDNYNTLTKTAPITNTTDPQYKSMITYAGIISSTTTNVGGVLKPDFDATNVFADSTNSANFIAATSQIYPKEGEMYNGTIYNRTDAEKSQGIWSFGYADVANNFITVNKKYDNLMMIASDVATVKGYTSSSSTTLSANSYYVLSFWVKTVEGAKASIIIDNQSNIYNATNDFDGFRSIDTNNVWVQYRLIIKVGFSDAQVKIGLYLGEPNANKDAAKRASGMVFFDDVNFVKLTDEDAYKTYFTAKDNATIKSYTEDATYLNAYNSVQASTVYSNSFVYEVLDYVTDSFDVHKDDAKEVLGNSPKDYTQAMDTGDDRISNDNETRAYGIYSADKMVSTTDYAAFLKTGTSYDDDDLRAQDWYTINTINDLSAYATGFGSNVLMLANFYDNAQYMKSSSKSLAATSYYRITFFAKAMLAEGEYAEFRVYKDSTSGVYTSVRIYGTDTTANNAYGMHQYTVYISNTTDSASSAYYSFHLGTGRITEKDDNGETITKVESHLVKGILVVDNVTLEKIEADDYNTAVGETAEAENTLKYAEATDADAYLESRQGYLEITKASTEDTTEDDTPEEEEDGTSWGANEWLILSSALISFVIVVAVLIYMFKQFKKKYVKEKTVGENIVNAEKKSEVAIKQQQKESNTAYAKDRTDFLE